MDQSLKFKITAIITALLLLSFHSNAQESMSNKTLTQKQQSIVSIAAITAKGDLEQLKPALNKGLDTDLTVNEIKEVLVHLYAYCGFPRSIRGLQTFMGVLEERQEKGINDPIGREATPIEDKRSKYERGKENLEKLTGIRQDGPQKGYAAFAPIIEVYLKEHLFADLFERDVLTFLERELATIAVIGSIGNAEPMLKSHLNICLKLGLLPEQLHHFAKIMSSINEKEGDAIQAVLSEVLTSADLTSNVSTEKGANRIFPKGELVTNDNFTGNVWVTMIVTDKEKFDLTAGNVLFESGSRTNWHTHGGGQILICTKGKGYFQEKGKAIQLLNVGDVVEIMPNIVHWHGASHESEFEHIAISTQQSKGGVVWLDAVTDDEYNRFRP